LAIEPEPGCYPETTEELVDVMQRLRMEGAGYLAQTYGISVHDAEDILRDYVGCCFDTAHQAVEFESLAASIERLQLACVRIAKVQVSSAIELDCANGDALAQLAQMQDETYLHQVGALLPNGDVCRWYDLPAFLADATALPPCVVRVHYHVPLFIDTFGALRATSALLRDALPVLCAASDHIEVETYTWHVWKQATGEQLPVHEGIARELQLLLKTNHPAPPR
jgi:hypothetical protein